MSISKQLTEAMRGSIYFESKLEIGSKFTFCIPLYQSTDNYFSTEIIIKTEMTIPIEFISKSDRNYLPHILEAEPKEEESKFFESSVNPLLLDENSEKSSEENNSAIVNESPKVLVVDDTAINIFVIQNLLRKLNVKSDTVHNLFSIYKHLLHRLRTD